MILHGPIKCEIIVHGREPGASTPPDDYGADKERRFRSPLAVRPPKTHSLSVRNSF